MQGDSHSLSDHSAFHLALIAFVCVVIALLSGSSPAPLAGSNWSTRQIDNRVEQNESPNLTAMPMVRIGIRFAEDHPEKVVEVVEPTDDDDTKHCLLRLDEAAFGSQRGLSESSADRAFALTPFRLRAFSSRGSPSA